MECKLLLDAFLELLALLSSQGVGLGNDGHDVDNIGELLQDDDIDRLERVTRGLDEEEAAVNAGVLDVTLSLCCELLAQVRGVLILDILDDRVPAAIVVDKVAIARGVDNVESQSNTILFNDVRGSLDLSGGADGLIGLKATLGIDEMRGKDGVDEGRLAQTSLTCDANKN